MVIMVRLCIRRLFFHIIYYIMSPYTRKDKQFYFRLTARNWEPILAKLGIEGTILVQAATLSVEVGEASENSISTASRLGRNESYL